ncbi:hypothetical protein [Bacillus sp. B-jedd]|uniref:hypothetical protein n=1 Tax=Bacillus sp. B-jedd TaxID=1476857 RepID=UPI000515676B|nr:hypothetical protein [Bacillus sp. B-jedd]CEG27185.1 hypothetical protein BN1002_02041 [Bacillus sp. B-jedd]
MIKTLKVGVAILLITFLSACTHFFSSPYPPGPSKNSMIIDIKNNTNFDVYGLELFLTNQSPIAASQTSVNGDGSKIKKGESLRFEFFDDDFVLDRNAEMKVEVLVGKPKGSNTNKKAINQKLTFELDKNKEVFFEITGDSIEKAEIKRLK